MQVTQIKVSAGRTFNHPFESYSNLRCDVHLDAHLAEGDDPKAATQQLQAQAEELCENHKQDLLRQINNLERLAQAQREISALEDRMQQASSRLKSLRAETAQLGAPRMDEGPHSDDDQPTDDLGF